MVSLLARIHPQATRLVVSQHLRIRLSVALRNAVVLL
jgi:hypothetical protein